MRRIVCLPENFAQQNPKKTKNTHNNRLMKVTQIGSLGLEMLFSFVFFDFFWFSKNF